MMRITARRAFCPRATRSKARASHWKQSPHPDTPRTILVSPYVKRTRCFPAITSWGGRRRSSARPDGSMNDYMASLERLRARSETIYWPGHGGPVCEPLRYVRALIHHRHQREAAILTRIKAGDTLDPGNGRAHLRRPGRAAQGRRRRSRCSRTSKISSRVAWCVLMVR